MNFVFFVVFKEHLENDFLSQSLVINCTKMRCPKNLHVFTIKKGGGGKSELFCLQLFKYEFVFSISI